MIIGSIDTLGQESLEYPVAIQKALDYLKTTDVTKLDDGKYKIPGTDYEANVQRYMTKDESECRPESHEKYVDIQYIAVGEEAFGWCPLSPNLTVSEAYNAEKDVGFFARLVPDTNIVLSPGCFAIVFPEDVHRPKGAANGEKMPVVKVVVKIPVSDV